MSRVLHSTFEIKNRGHFCIFIIYINNVLQTTPININTTPITILNLCLIIMICICRFLYGFYYVQLSLISYCLVLSCIVL